MSKNAKTLLIVFGILGAVLIICAVGVGIFVYKTVDSSHIQENEIKGADFGRTTDNLGCQTNVISQVKEMGMMDIAGSLNATAFFKSCLRTSRKNTNFCEGVPGEISDKLNGDAWKDAECEKSGIKPPHLPCRTVMKVKTEHCGFR